MPHVHQHIAESTLSLGERDAALFSEFAQLCASGCAGADAFRDIVRRYVKPLLPHSFSIAVLGSLNLDQIEIREMVGVDYPERFLAAIPRRNKLADRPVVARWLRTRAPIILDPIRDREFLSELELKEVETLGLGRLAIHGQIDLSSRMASYFSFAGTSPNVTDERATLILQLITPHLHMALMSIPAMALDSLIVERLTRTEIEIVRLLSAGHSNAEIGAMRGRSPSTVRNQLHALYAKLEVGSRAEAVALIAQLHAK